MVGIGALLSLQHEAIALIGIQAAKAGGAVAIVLKDAALEHIVILRIVGLTAPRRVNADERSKAVHETLRIRQLRAAGDGPVGDEGVYLIVI